MYWKVVLILSIILVMLIIYMNYLESKLNEVLIRLEDLKEYVLYKKLMYKITKLFNNCSKIESIITEYKLGELNYCKIVCSLENCRVIICTYFSNRMYCFNFTKPELLIQQLNCLINKLKNYEEKIDTIILHKNLSYSETINFVKAHLVNNVSKIIDSCLNYLRDINVTIYLLNVNSNSTFIKLNFLIVLQSKGFMNITSFSKVFKINFVK